MDASEYFARLNPQTNLIEVISISTGLVVQIHGDIDSVSRAPVDFSEITLESGQKILVQKGVNLDNLPLPVNQTPYSLALASIFCGHISQGIGLTKACKIPGMPSYYTLCHWRKRYPEFREMLDEALQNRADYLADQALDIALEDRLIAEEIQNAKLQVDTLKWAAEKANPARYGNKVQHSGKIDHAVQMVIDTGIRRTGDPGYFPDETEKLKLVEEGGKILNLPVSSPTPGDTDG